MSFTETEVHELVEQVLTGQISRADLLKDQKPGCNQRHIVVAVALILANGQGVACNTNGEYVLDATHKTYSAWIDELLLAGTGDQRRFPAVGRRSITSLLGASQKIGMHRSVGKGRAAQIFLQPSPALVQLIGKHADNSAVKAFFNDATTALAAEKQAADEYRASQRIQ